VARRFTPHPAQSLRDANPSARADARYGARSLVFRAPWICSIVAPLAESLGACCEVGANTFLLIYRMLADELAEYEIGFINMPEHYL
jgi:hypothetical protein